jgi:hypothetical protein
MAIQIISDHKLFIDGFDRSGDFNRFNMQYTVDELDSTTIGDTTKEFLAGLIDMKFDGEVFTSHGTGEVETVSYANFNTADKIISLYPSSTAGTVGHAFESLELEMSPIMKIGDLARMTIRASNSGSAVIRVTDMEGLVTKTTTGDGTVRQLGAVSATQKLYSVLHVTSASASDSLTVTVKSDSIEGFSSPTTQITHTAFTDEGAEIKTADGAITDTWYRISWTITGTSPSFAFDVGVGIK